jgi:hypothetical protein
MALLTRKSSNSQVVKIALDCMTADRVFEVAQRMGLEPSASDAAATLRRRVLRSRRLTEQRILQMASVFELQDICRQLGLNAQGREAEILRHRIQHAHQPQFQIAGNELPPEAVTAASHRRRQRRMRWLGGFVGWTIVTVLWAACGGGLYYALVWILAADPTTRLLFAALGTTATGLLRLFHCGRFLGIAVYAAPLIAGTLLSEQHEFLELPEASAGRLMFVWGIAMATGAFMGIEQDLTRDDRY